jgi:hypothetical protein
VPAILAQGTLTDGSSWFLEALNKVWTKSDELLYHTNNGGGKKRDTELDKAGAHSKECQSYNRALRWNTMDEQALRSVWVKTMPQLSAVLGMLHQALTMCVQLFGWHKGDLPIEQLFDGSLA